MTVTCVSPRFCVQSRDDVSILFMYSTLSAPFSPALSSTVHTRRGSYSFFLSLSLQRRSEEFGSALPFFSGIPFPFLLHQPIHLLALCLYSRLPLSVSVCEWLLASPTLARAGHSQHFLTRLTLQPACNRSAAEVNSASMQ